MNGPLVAAPHDWEVVKSLAEDPSPAKMVPLERDAMFTSYGLCAFICGGLQGLDISHRPHQPSLGIIGPPDVTSTPQKEKKTKRKGWPYSAGMIVYQGLSNRNSLFAH